MESRGVAGYDSAGALVPALRVQDIRGHVVTFTYRLCLQRLVGAFAGVEYWAVAVLSGGASAVPYLCGVRGQQGGVGGGAVGLG